MKHPYAFASATFVACSLHTLTASAWGPVGHQTIAFIAEDNLTPAAAAQVRRLLGPDLGLADVANWADDVRVSLRPETANWHFIQIADRGSVTRADESKFCKGSDCVVDQINADISVLRNPSTTTAQRFEALKFLVHFVGDVHQPLHCANDDDRGGNEKIVVFLKPGAHGKPTRMKLHAFWDHLVELRTADDPKELALALGESITTEQKKKWATGTAADWAWESHTIAHDVIYPDFQPGPTPAAGIPLPKDYQSPKMREIVDGQLQKAGLRLAHTLNAIFGT